MKEPLITVIIPVYNAEKYLERCVRSVTGNTYSNLEIICVNDGSSDNSLSVLEKLATDDSRIRIIDKPNGGVSTARNAGLDAATGEYVAFIDSDDWIHDSYFSILMKEAQDSNSDITIASYVDVYGDDTSGSSVRVSAPEHVHTALAAEVMARDGYFRRSVWGRIYKREVVADKRFPLEIHFGEDLIYNVLIADSPTCRVTVFELPLYFYYQVRSDSLVHAKPLDANYLLGSWFVDHIEQFEQKNIAVCAALSALLTYRYEGSFSKDAKTVRRRAKQILNQCVRVLLRDVNCSAATKTKYILFAHAPFAYRLVLRLTDRSIIHYEKILKERYA